MAERGMAAVVPDCETFARRSSTKAPQHQRCCRSAANAAAVCCETQRGEVLRLRSATCYRR
jgi:hypothetical protein